MKCECPYCELEIHVDVKVSTEQRRYILREEMRQHLAEEHGALPPDEVIDSMIDGTWA